VARGCGWRLRLSCRLSLSPVGLQSPAWPALPLASAVGATRAAPCSVQCSQISPRREAVTCTRSPRGLAPMRWLTSACTVAVARGHEAAIYSPSGWRGWCQRTHASDARRGTLSNEVVANAGEPIEPGGGRTDSGVHRPWAASASPLSSRHAAARVADGAQRASHRVLARRTRRPK